MELAAGMKILYVPHLDHALDTGRDGKPVFHWVHAKAAPNGAHPVREGEAVDWSRVEPKRNVGEASPHVREPAESDYSQGAKLRGPYGHLMKPGAPKSFWPGVVADDPEGFRRRAIAAIAAKHAAAAVVARELSAEHLADVCRLAGLDVPEHDPSDGLILVVKHPNGVATNYLHLSGPNAVTHDPDKKKHHSYHVEDE